MMSHSQQTTLYKQVIDVTADYLGPAAQRFIDRQIETHLQKQPEQLTKADLTKLVDWIKIVIALLTEDKKTVDNFTEELLRLRKQ